MTAPAVRSGPLAGLRVLAPGATSIADTRPAAVRPTLHHLLTHTAGFSYAFQGGVLGPVYSAAKLGTNPGGGGLELMVEHLATLPLACEPGSAWHYGVSTDVLGRVIEVISGMPLGQFLQERLFAPLGMTDSAFIVPPEKRDRLAQPFAVDRATDKPINLLDVTVAQKNDAGGAGSVGTTLDFARFLQMLINGGQLDGVRLLSPSTVAYMSADHLGPNIKFSGATTLPAGTGFGLGFAVRKEAGLFEVTGSKGEYFWGGAAGTGFYVDPQEGIICVWMTQGQPGIARRLDRYLFKQMVYQAIAK